jgi:DNA-binding PadR family transcriptional regulator
MDVQSILLGLLMGEGMTGYDLRKVFSISFSFFSDLSYGSIYPNLNRMERQGLITMEVKTREGSPNRKVYTITEAGRKVFLDALKMPETLERFKSHFLMRLFFFAHLSPEERKAIGESHLEEIRKLHRELESARPEIEAHADRFQYLCFQFGVRLLRDMARNVSEVVHALENQETDLKELPKKASEEGHDRKTK